MKTLCHDPFAAVRETGGCTFEPDLGWWTQCASSDQADELGDGFADARDAIYIPTLQKSGEPVTEETVSALKAQARELGMTEIVRAAGMWVLSETDEVQTETIWIAHTGGSELPEAAHAKLEELARHIQDAANQDCVAWENGGHLHFTG